MESTSVEIKSNTSEDGSVSSVDESETERIELFIDIPDIKTDKEVEYAGDLNSIDSEKFCPKTERSVRKEGACIHSVSQLSTKERTDKVDLGFEKDASVEITAKQAERENLSSCSKEDRDCRTMGDAKCNNNQENEVVMAEVNKNTSDLENKNTSNLENNIDCCQKAVVTDTRVDQQSQSGTLILGAEETPDHSLLIKKENDVPHTAGNEGLKVTSEFTPPQTLNFQNLHIISSPQASKTPVKDKENVELSSKPIFSESGEAWMDTSQSPNKTLIQVSSLVDYDSSESENTSSSSSSSEDSSSDSDSETSSSSLSESENDEPKPDEQQKVPSAVKTTSELTLKDLPDVECPQITLSNEVVMAVLGKVSSIIGQLVVIQSEPGTPALNEDTVLFKENRQAFGAVFEIFGPVLSPLYTVRFNTVQEITDQEVQLNMIAYYAPRRDDITNYVFVRQLESVKGSDASWKNDEEPPPELIDYSDDEQERMAKKKTNMKKEKRKEAGRRGSNEVKAATTSQKNLGFVGGHQSQNSRHNGWRNSPGGRDASHNTPGSHRPSSHSHWGSHGMQSNPRNTFESRPVPPPFQLRTQHSFPDQHRPPAPFGPPSGDFPAGPRNRYMSPSPPMSYHQGGHPPQGQYGPGALNTHHYPQEFGAPGPQGPHGLYGNSVPCFPSGPPTPHGPNAPYHSFGPDVSRNPHGPYRPPHPDFRQNTSNPNFSEGVPPHRFQNMPLMQSDTGQPQINSLPHFSNGGPRFEALPDLRMNYDPRCPSNFEPNGSSFINRPPNIHGPRFS